MMTELGALLGGVPSWFAVIVLAMLPIGELRGALPVALTLYGLPLIPAMLLSVVGNMLPVYFILTFLEKVVPWSRTRSQYAERFWEWLFERTRRKLEGKVEKYGPWALAMFVAVPLPVTGAWTGSVAAFVFGVPKTKAFFSTLLGVCIASIIVAVVTLGASLTVRSLI
jgi:uncharacterized membrane protein